LRKFLADCEQTQTIKGTTIAEPSDKQVADFAILCKRFYQSLSDNINGRFSEASLLSQAKVLCPSVWPEEEVERMLFGDQEVYKMATLFGLDVATALAEFREHKVNVKRVGKTWAP